MDLESFIWELHAELKRIDEAIFALEHLSAPVPVARIRRSRRRPHLADMSNAATAQRTCKPPSDAEDDQLDYET
jgi:hypothetical protein